MQRSTETRWILTSNQVAIVEHWFEKYNEKFLDQKSFPRQDYYLKTNSKNLGIKIREPKVDPKGNILAKLELKSLLENFGAQKFDNQNTGLVNSWVKYSFDLDPKNNPLHLIYKDKILSNEWILIEKDRLLVKFDTNQNKIVSSKEMIDNGAGIELTKFMFNDKIQFSLGVESFTENKNPMEVFLQTIQFLFDDIKINGLEFKNSKTYPEILLEF